MLFKIKGILDFTPQDVTKKHKNQSYCGVIMKTIKSLVILVLALLLTSCGYEPPPDQKVEGVGFWTESTRYYVLPPEMEGCKIFVLVSLNEPNLRTIICDNVLVKSTTYKLGKDQFDITGPIL